MRLYNYINETNPLVSFNEIRELLTELSMEMAIDFAETMHKGQIRKGNKKPYVVHPKAVYSILKSFNIKDKVILIAAWLHDTIEDTQATYNTIKNQFNKEVAELVKQLSSDKKGIEALGKEEYLLKKMLKMDNNALTLKLADRLHNVSDIMSMPNGQKVYNQTTYIIQGLRDKRTLNKKHKKIIKAIERYLNQFSKTS